MSRSKCSVYSESRFRARGLEYPAIAAEHSWAVRMKNPKNVIVILHECEQLMIGQRWKLHPTKKPILSDANRSDKPIK